MHGSFGLATMLPNPDSTGVGHVPCREHRRPAQGRAPITVAVLGVSSYVNNRHRIGSSHPPSKTISLQTCFSHQERQSPAPQTPLAGNAAMRWRCLVIQALRGMLVSTVLKHVDRPAPTNPSATGR